MAKIPSIIVGIDLGNSSYKAVRLQRRGNQYVLTRAALVPIERDPASTAPLTEQTVVNQIKALTKQVKAADAEVHYTINSANSTVRYVELPKIPLEEVRSALKLNSANYLRQNFENYTFDACPLDAEAAEALIAAKKKPAKGAAAPGGKAKTLVGGISSPEVMLYFHASRGAGIKPRSLQLTPISLINGFEAAYPEIFHGHAIALLDLGFLSSSLTILDKGTPLLTRTVPMGAKHITDYIVQMGSMDFAKAEAAKIQGDPMLNDAVSRTAVTLIREVRSSINFFEKNSDQAIGRVYLTGASVASAAIIEALSNDVGVACDPWNPAEGMVVELPADQQAAFAQNPYAFGSALGVARTYAVAPPAAKKAPAAPAAASQSKVAAPAPA